MVSHLSQRFPTGAGAGDSPRRVSDDVAEPGARPSGPSLSQSPDTGGSRGPDGRRWMAATGDASSSSRKRSFEVSRLPAGLPPLSRQRVDPGASTGPAMQGGIGRLSALHRLGAPNPAGFDVDAVPGFVLLNGRLHRPVPLSLTAFIHRLVPLEAPQARDTGAVPRQVMAQVGQDTVRNRDEAEKVLGTLKGLLLDNFPFTQEVLSRKSLAQLADFVGDDEERRIELLSAIDHYRTLGDHVLMNAMLGGHKSLGAFLQAVAPGRYASEEDIEHYCEAFLDRYGGAKYYGPQDMLSRFEEEDGGLQDETRLLDRFLQGGSPIANLCLVKGMSHLTPHGADMTTQVDVPAYVRAFLANQPVMFGSFLSASCDWDEAVSFTSCEDIADRPLYSIDLADGSARSDALRAMCLASLSNPGDKADAIVLVIKAVRAKGCLLDAVSPPPDGTSEKEVLLAPGHLLVPTMIVRCENGYVLMAEAHHRPAPPQALRKTPTG